MDVRHNPVPHVADVLPHDPFRFQRVSFPKCLDQEPVLCQGFLHPVRKAYGRQAEHPDVIVERRNQVDQPAGP